MAAQFAAGGAVIPFVTLLFRERGLSLEQISLVFTAASATMLVSPFFWGMLADRFVPLNRLFLILNLLAGTALAFLARQHSFPGLLLSGACYFACFNPTLYLLNAISFRHLRDPREQFGRLRAWGSLGWIIPFLPIALGLAWWPEAPLDGVVYLGIACCGLMALISFWLPHTPPLAAERSGGRDGRAGPTYASGVLRLVRDTNYIVILGSMFLVAGAFSLMTYYSPALLQDAGVTRPWIGPVQSIAVMFEIVLFQWQPALLRRWNYAGLVLAGCAALACRHLVFATADSVWALAASYLLAGAVVVFYYQGVSILVNVMAAREVRATAQTLLLLFGQGLGPLFANAVTSRLSVHFHGLRPVFWFAAALASTAALVVLWRAPHLNAAGRELSRGEPA
jgi:MFS family permease